MNQLYYGDCLDVLRKLYRQHPHGFIDLIYIDPPFNSKRNYNILFESIDLEDANAQKQAFADTWSNYDYKDTITELAELDLDLYKFLKALDDIRISDSAVAYLTTMSIRIWYMQKLLKETGSFYLHCDPTMSHYLKLICDLIFGEKNFRNEITWQRTNVHNDARNKFADVNDIIILYSKSSKAIFNPQYQTHNEEYVASFYRFDDSDGRGLFTLADMASPNPRPNMMYEWKGFPHPAKGWRYEKETMKRLDEEKRIYYPTNSNGTFDTSKRPRLKRYLNEQKGTLTSNNWTDIYPLGAHEKERLGYPTQKPIALMERIIKASSNENDLVADFFCGCGTTIAAAQKLNRQWLGADISHLAIRLITKRLVETYGKEIRDKIKIDGFPADIASAKELSLGKGGRFDFQDWVIEVLLNGVKNPKKVADGGYDGYLTFETWETAKKLKKEVVVIEVKSGGVDVKKLREFIQVVDKQKAALGIYACFADEVTKPMEKEAKEAGYYMPERYDKQYPKIQILTIEELMKHHNHAIKMPRTDLTTFKKAERETGKAVGKGLFE